MCLAIPGRIADVTGTDVTRSGRVDFGGVSKIVNLAYVPDARPGDYVLVHVGFGIAVIDEPEAQSLIETLAQIDDLDSDEPAQEPR